MVASRTEGRPVATIEIPDDLYLALRADMKKRLLTEDVSKAVESVVRRLLVDACTPGFDHDGLTKCLTRQKLREYLNRALFGTGWTDGSVYRNRFLTIDLDDFKHYLDVHGLSAGDAVLRSVADGLREHFGNDAVYRAGGDEYVVTLGDREPWTPPAIEDVVVTHAVVDVAVHRNQHRNHHVVRWIELHIDTGILASRREGVRIECGDPVWLRPEE